MHFLFGLLWFVVGIIMASIGLAVVWRAEHNKWLNFFGFHHELPWYGLVCVVVVGFLSTFFWYIQPDVSALVIFLQIILAAVLAVTFISDMHFSAINLPVLGVGSVAVLVGIALHQSWLPSLLSALAAAGIAALFFLWQYVLSRGQWVGIGDACFGAFLGLFTGWYEILFVAAGGYGLAAFTAFVLIFIFRKKNLHRLPLGAFLSFASMVFFLLSLTRYYGAV